MGRFSVNEADNYGGGQSNFFSLRDDGDTAKVRFMYNSAEDVTGLAVHEVEVDGKKRNVNCLRAYNEPKANCPLCNAGFVQKAKLYIPVYDIESNEVKVWERGKNFLQKLAALCARYSNSDTPLVSHTFDIERHGKKGDTGTQYEIYETGCDKTTLEDLPEIPDVLEAGIVMDKSFEDLEYFIDEDEFPNRDGAPNRDNASNRERATSRQSEESQPTGRRTPTSGRRGPAF